MTPRRGIFVPCGSAARVQAPGPGTVARSDAHGTPLLVQAYWKREWPLPFDPASLPFPVANPHRKQAASAPKGARAFWAQGTQRINV